MSNARFQNSGIGCVSSSRTPICVEGGTASVPGSLSINPPPGFVGKTLIADGDVDITGVIDPTGTLYTASAARPVTSSTNQGLIWVQSGTPTQLVFTDSAGTDFTVGGTSSPSVQDGTWSPVTVSSTNIDTVTGITYAASQFTRIADTWHASFQASFATFNNDAYSFVIDVNSLPKGSALIRIVGAATVINTSAPRETEAATVNLDGGDVKVSGFGDADVKTLDCFLMFQ